MVRSGPDKLYNTELGDRLERAGTQTVVLVGTCANGAVLYTATELNVRGYTVVVAEDAISSPTEFNTALARYQLLHEPTRWNNAQNPRSSRTR